MWALNCEYLLDYLERKQSKLRPDDYSLEFPYKNVRLQVERGDARPQERLKAVRLMYVELDDDRFVDCPVDMRMWLKQCKRQHNEKHIVRIGNKIRIEEIFGRKLLQLRDEVLETKREEPRGPVFSVSPLHEDASENDLFAVSADSQTLGSAFEKHRSRRRRIKSSYSRHENSTSVKAVRCSLLLCFRVRCYHCSHKVLLSGSGYEA
mgnify:CR=1 FL=1